MSWLSRLFKKKEKEIVDYQKIEEVIYEIVNMEIERKFAPMFGQEIADIKNISYKMKADYDFMKLTIIELLQFMQQTEKDNKRKEVYSKVIEKVKKEINILTPEQEKKLRKGEAF